MKNLMLFLLLLLVSLFMFSCGGNDDDEFDPTDVWNMDGDDADWFISFAANTDTKDNDYMVMATYLGDSGGVSATDIVSLEINGSPIAWTVQMPGFYHCFLMLNPGQSYSVAFKFNGSTLISKDLSMPNDCVGSFPQTFSPEDVESFSWTMSANNQYQVAGATSYKTVSQTEQLNSEYSKSLAPSLRSFSVPGGSVDDFGTGTYYSLFIDQFNFVKQNRVAMIAWQGDYRDYPDKGARTTEALARHALRLYDRVR